MNRNLKNKELPEHWPVRLLMAYSIISIYICYDPSTVCLVALEVRLRLDVKFLK